MPNAGAQARLEAGAERTLEGVACRPWFGVGLATAPRSGTHELDSSLLTPGRPHHLRIALGQARLLVSTDIQPHIFVVHGKALRREERPRLRIERPDVERHRGEPMFLGELDHRLDKSVSTAPPVMCWMTRDVVNMQALPGVAQFGLWPSDDLGIEVADRFVMEGPNEDTRVRIREQLTHERCGGNVSGEAGLKRRGRASACTVCTAALSAEMISASFRVANRTSMLSPSGQ